MKQISRLRSGIALLSLGLAAAFAPVSVQAGIAPSDAALSADVIFGTADLARRGRGADDAPGDDRGGRRGRGTDDAPGDDRGGRGRGADDGPNHTLNVQEPAFETARRGRGADDAPGDDRGGRGRGTDDGPNHT